MNMNPQAKPSILKANQPQGEKQKKRTSFSDDVLNTVDPMRRASGLSIPGSENTTDDSNKSAETFDFCPKTSSFPANNNPNMRVDKARPTARFNVSDSTISSRSTNTECFPFNELNLHRMKALLNSTFWTILILCLSLILVFGSTIMNFLPKAVDPYFDIIFLVTLVILSLDIVMMCYTTPMYFVFKPSMKLKKGSDETGCLCFSFQFGSFTFWFDVISVVSILFDISYIFKSSEIRHVLIYLNDQGFPQSLGEPHTLTWDQTILSVILSTARVARLLRVEVVTKLQSWTTCLGKSVRTRENRRTFGRKIFKDSQQVGNSMMEERHKAAIKIQRAWRDQNTNVYVGAFMSSGQTKNHSIRMPLHPSFHNTSHASREEDEFPNQMAPRRRYLGRRRSQSNTVRADRNLTSRYNRRGNEEPTSSKKDRRKRKKSQIGEAMNEMTMRRVAVGMMIAITLTAFFTYAERNNSRELTTLTMHNTLTSLYENDKSAVTESNTELMAFLKLQLESSTPDMFNYTFQTREDGEDPGAIIELSCSDFDIDCNLMDDVRDWGKRKVQICSDEERCTLGSTAIFVQRNLSRRAASVSLIFIIFLLLVWILALLLFVGPVTTLVVYPIERMIKLLAMLVKDPLGYSKTKKYRQFTKEDDEFAYNTMWTPESLNGMETSFLMSTILRIGSLMKVGFGSAGVEIIRSNLQKSTRQSISLTGGTRKIDSTVACIFMFCDIRGFTDSSECLNEEVFVFTNRIAAVVHSYCHAYGGSANKNIGDAFLLSWQLDNPPLDHPSDLYASKRQADKALLSVVKICIALYHEYFFLEGLSQGSIKALKRKFEKRPGNLVQLGFGLHAGKAVEGAIGSQRKLDATYLSEAVELAEFLESSTKKYGATVLMSGKFYSLLHKSVREKCRKIDHIFFTEEYEDDDPSGLDETFDDNHMSLHTLDMDIETLFKKSDRRTPRERTSSELSSVGAMRKGGAGSFREDRLRNSGTNNLGGSLLTFRRMSMMMGHRSADVQHSRQSMDDRSVKSGVSCTREQEEDTEEGTKVKKKLVIPDGHLMYSNKVWHEKELLIIRERFTPAFYEKFNSGYQAYIRSDWKKAKREFEYMVSFYNDKPSKYFLDKMRELKDKPPQNFRWRYDIVSMEYH